MLKELLSYIVVGSPRTHTRTALMKLVYLVEREYRRRYGGPLTGASFKMYFYGPYSREVAGAIDELVAEHVLVEERCVSADGEREYYVYLPTLRAARLAEEFERKHPEGAEVAREVLEEHGGKSLEELLEYVYDLPEVRRAKFLSPLLRG